MFAGDVVAVIDDSELSRDVVRKMLEAVAIEVRAYPSARAFLDDPDFRRAGCLVLDVRMPGMSGLELQRTLNDMKWMVPILFLSAHGDIPMVVEAMRNGAVGFMQKPFKEQELIEHVQASLTLCRRRRQFERLRETLRARLELLTAREREVLHLVASGRRTKEIAQLLSITVKTVEEHRANLLRKTRTKSMLELVGLAAQEAVLAELRADGVSR
jgi:FixJ family two-component response regulator